MDMNDNEVSETNLLTESLLREVLGDEFLGFVLNLPPQKIGGWLSGGDLGSKDDRRREAFQQLVLMLQDMLQTTPAQDGDLRYLHASSMLTQYIDAAGTSLAGAVRLFASGEASQTFPDNADGWLSSLAYDMYPVYLIPQTGPFPHRPMSFFMPAQQEFQARVSEDEVLMKLFPFGSTERDEHGIRHAHGIFHSNAGSGGTMQLAQLADSTLQSAWLSAQSESDSLPTRDAFIESAIARLAEVRQLANGKSVNAPLRIGFMGVKFPPGTVVDLGWGVLRGANERDRNELFSEDDGELTAHNPDGTVTSIRYSGDIVLETTRQYRINISKAERTTADFPEWPKEVLPDHRTVTNLIDDVRLGALLSSTSSPTQPTVLHMSWINSIDPVSNGTSIGRNDTRRTKPFMPRLLNEVEVADLASWISKVHDGRDRSVEIAISRTVRAVAERQDFTDALVDAVIAWENLFGSANGELTFKVSSSLAWLLAPDDPSRRNSLFGELKKIYKARSMIVHGGGSLDLDKLSKDSRRAIEVAVDALRELFTSRTDLLQMSSGDERGLAMLLLRGAASSDTGQVD